jgi:hypothetical protein
VPQSLELIVAVLEGKNALSEADRTKVAQLNPLFNSDSPTLGSIVENNFVMNEDLTALEAGIIQNSDENYMQDKSSPEVEAFQSDTRRGYSGRIVDVNGDGQVELGIDELGGILLNLDVANFQTLRQGIGMVLFNVNELIPSLKFDPNQFMGVNQINFINVNTITSPSQIPMILGMDQEMTDEFVVSKL